MVTYFLLSQLKNSEYLRSLKGCYPCLDKTHESDFRKGVIDSFKKLEKDSMFNYKFSPGIVCNPGGDQFVSLYLAFLNFVLKKIMNLVDLKLAEQTVDEIKIMIEEDKKKLIENLKKLEDQTEQQEQYCGHFDLKLSAIKNDEKDLETRLKEIDLKLVKKFGTTDCDVLMNDVKENFEQIKSHKLRKLFEENVEVLKTEIIDIEQRTIDLRDIIDKSSISPIDLIEIQKLFKDKLDHLKQTMDQGK